MTKLNLSNSLKLSITIKKLIINLIILLTIGDEERERTLAKQIMVDLDYLQNKKDIEFVNNILTPLLKAENKVPVSFDFYDNTNEKYLSFNKINDEGKDVAKYYNFLSRPELSEISKYFKEWNSSANFNEQKLMISKWKMIHSMTGRPNAAGYDEMLRKMLDKTCFFILIEGQCKTEDPTSKLSDRDSKKYGQK